MRRIVVGAVVVGLLALPAGAQALKPVGALTQLTGIDGCWSLTGASEDGAGTCHDARALSGPYSVALSPNGGNVYAGLYDGDGLVAFERGSSSGTLEQLGPAPGFVSADGCITSNGMSVDAPVPGACTNGRAVAVQNDGRNIVVSPDGAFLYMGAGGSDAIAIFSRDPAHGKLTQLAGTLGCISSDGSSEDGPGTCADGRLVDEVDALALSPDGATLYAANGGDGIAVFTRNSSTGALTQLPGSQGCTSFEGSSEDGAATCANGKAIQDLTGVVVSSDGAHVYSAAYDSDAVAAFRRDPTTGALTQLAGSAGCISDDGASDEGPGTCADGRALNGTWGIDISRDGRSVYAPALDVPGLTAFARDAATGQLTQLAGTDGCITPDGSSSDGADTCQASRGLASPDDATVAPDGLNVYVGDYDTGVGAVLAFRRDPATGRLSQIPGVDGCYSADGSSDDDGAGTCTDIRGGAGSGPLALSRDGAFLYAPGYDDDTIVALARQIPASCSDTKAATRSNKPVTVPLTCTDLNGDPITLALTSRPANGTLGSIDQTANNVVYTPAKDFGGSDSFTFAATDGGELPSIVATATITVRDTVATNCTVRTKRARLRKLRKGRAIFKLRCKEAGTVFAELLAKRKAAGVLGLLTKVRRTKIGAGKKKATGAGTVRVKVKVRRLARQGLKELTLRQAKRLKLALRVRAVDTAGNKSKRKTTKLKLRR